MLTLIWGLGRHITRVGFSTKMTVEIDSQHQPDLLTSPPHVPGSL
jgi:hypothetical protein